MSERTTAGWVAGARAVDLEVGTDQRGLAHILLPDSVWAMCDWFIIADHPDAAATAVCMHCRELPGRERHARKVDPDWATGR